MPGLPDPHAGFGVGALVHILRSQLITKLPYPDGDYADKTVIVSGSNVGLGKEAARHYVRLGVKKLILAVRSIEKGEAAKKDFQSTNPSSPTNVEIWRLDMASYDSVKSFAKRAGGLERLDICIANAGLVQYEWSQAEDNETTITVNVVSTFLLTALLLPKMRQTSKQYNTQPTFTITSSGAHSFTTFPQKSAPEGELFNTINDEKDVANFKQQYPLSKLLEIYAVRSIADKYPNPIVPVNCVDPGLCHSDLAKDAGWGVYLLKVALARTTEYGSRTLFHAAEQGKDSHGGYFSDCRLADPALLVTSEEGKKVQERVWTELTAKLEKIQPGVTKNFG
ncbi:hypothetical protein B0A48_03351 [Cryoendolithus antarcticus]|uniref:Uncharacterized protein n=1 Tax=Cryoendolithus antarcticus TaxID=1507870 RepID=A0A1V8TJZ4_9PEZI|nr:hypothetical protein B0A48_03351 [Cryoendolithus antarcticus]